MREASLITAEYLVADMLGDRQYPEAGWLLTDVVNKCRCFDYPDFQRWVRLTEQLAPMEGPRLTRIVGAILKAMTDERWAIEDGGEERLHWTFCLQDLRKELAGTRRERAIQAAIEFCGLIGMGGVFYEKEVK